jgi:hypothetical protein
MTFRQLFFSILLFLSNASGSNRLYENISRILLYFPKSCHDMSINRATTKLMLLAAVLIGAAVTSALGTMTSSVAYAQEATGNGGHGTPREEPGQQDDPECWGEVTNQLAQQEGSRPGIGEHVSNPIPNNDDPHDTPRLGVGNQAQDTPAEHGEFVGGLIGIGCEDDRDN